MSLYQYAELRDSTNPPNAGEPRPLFHKNRRCSDVTMPQARTTCEVPTGLQTFCLPTNRHHLKPEPCNAKLILEEVVS